MNKIGEFLLNMADTVLPRHCSVCQRVLSAREKHLCQQCLAKLPLTKLHTISFNSVEQLFAGKVPVERATGYFWYEKDGANAAILQDIKYRNCPQMAMWLAQRAAAQMPDFFADAELIVPVPLHITKLAQRGYNQSLLIAQGIEKVTHIPIAPTALVATRPSSTQTRKGAYDRYINTQGLYEANPKQTSEISGKHILIVDDVITTGATLCVCAQALLDAGAAKISIFALAAAKLT